MNLLGLIPRAVPSARQRNPLRYIRDDASAGAEPCFFGEWLSGARCDRAARRDEDKRVGVVDCRWRGVARAPVAASPDSLAIRPPTLAGFAAARGVRR